MLVKKLELSNYRNYSNLFLELSDGLNIIYGDNAQGKTNILEAVYLFSLGSSHRTTQDKELILFGEDRTNLKLQFISHNMVQTAEIEIEKSKRKNIKINESKINRISEMVGRLDVVILCPENLELVKEGPSVRRKNLDILISQLRPRYFMALKQYKKVILNKNTLLKSIRNKPQLIDTLPVWNEKIAALGAEIIKYRQEYISLLNSLCIPIHNKITAKKEKFNMEYDCSIGDIKEKSVKELKEIILQKIENHKQKELEYAESIVGPHRDDIVFYINEKHVKNFGSQGQQKTVVLTHKLAEAELIKKQIGEYPVLLLDDVMSELDNKRQNYIVNKIKGMQIIITCTDKIMFENLENTKMFNVKNGKVKI